MTQSNIPSQNEYNQKIREDIFPSKWNNPTTEKTYDLLIIGAGPGGMTAATVARSLNASVALVEKEHFGGECLSYGCIPSKALLRSSRLAGEMQHAKELGLEIGSEWKVNFSEVMQRVHRLQSVISPHDSAQHFKELGIDIFLGEGHFIGSNKLEVRGQAISFKKAIIITGTHPLLLNLPGLDEADYLTNQSIFNLTSLPPRLSVIGGGPIGCELAQAFLQLGSHVTLITHAEHLLPRDDRMASERLRNVFTDSGMKIFTNTQIQRVEKRGSEKIVYLDSNAEPLVVDEMLVAIGRKPTVEGLDLAKAGVTYDQQKGISTNNFLQTSNPDIYAAGDVTSLYKFTHISKELSKMAVINALNGNKEKSSSLIIPWCTFTEPEIAHIGLNEQEAKEQRISLETVMIEMATVDRAILDEETVGFVKLLVKEDSDEIVGGTIMAAHAADLISELSVAMNSEKGLIALSKAIHPFPVQAQVLRTAAETLIKKRQTLHLAYK
jgi:pyruvate/2-oxoglutarate dehydrogenase complex dihydrolipoamide dehydrogenase (E3) component